jgi:RHS repeat-associated protein
MGNVSQRMDPSGATQDYVFGLELLTHRYYDSGTGRFVTRDPIGYSGGINIYRYAGNNPIEWIDPDGLAGRALSAPPTRGPDGLKLPPGTDVHPDPNNPAHDPNYDIDIPKNPKSGMPRIRSGATRWRYFPDINGCPHWQEKEGSKRNRENREALRHALEKLKNDVEATLNCCCWMLACPQSLSWGYGSYCLSRQG